MKLSKINGFNAISILIILLLLLVVNVSAETTFFDNSDDAFIVGNSTTNEGVIGTTGATTSGGVLKNYAKQLFDIKFELDYATIKNSNELSAVITFASFGTVPTFVDLTYKILNSSGAKVYSEKGNVLVTTEQIVRKNFKTLNLPDGKYTLILTTVYGDNVTDEFKQEFSVSRVESLKNENNWMWLVIAGVAVIALIILTLIIYKKNKKVKHRRKKQHERFYKKK